jgi:hypothetical protein
MRRSLPNLVIAGAQKSGTTSLHHLLAGHPDVFFPEEPQEIQYFAVEEDFARGLDWYAGLFARWAGERWIGQTSPLYMFQPLVPERMAAVLPDARVVFILRDPVKRAYSHYWHEVRYGFEDHSFEEALELEPERLRGGFLARRHFSYAARGRYAEQLARFAACFPRPSLLVLLHEELQADPKVVLERCAAFLGVDPDGFGAPDGRAAHRNAAQLPRLPSAQRWVRPLRGRYPLLGSLVDHLNLREGRYPPMAPATAERLRARFADEPARLRELAGVDVAPWWR